MSTINQQVEHYRRRIERVLSQFLPTGDSAKSNLQQAMHYSVTAGGKRIRPVLAYATGDALGVNQDRLDAAACAVELMHAYSLVHDDLPAMDDDDLRRGMPTCHRKFDEATAILAGDALQALAFTVLADNPDQHISTENKLRMISILGNASGAHGMATGQAIDLEAVGKKLDLAQLEDMHRHKTGALIQASIIMASLSANLADRELEEKLNAYGAAIGLAFQIVDDILDITADTETLGKRQGADLALNKPTYPALLGLDGARRHAMHMHETALASLSDLGANFDILRNLSALIVNRSH